MPSIKEKLLTEFLIPEINGNRCVHAHIETASCKACVTACPENAWILDDESLGLNTEACDGCGLCVPACTEGAILQTQNCAIREDNTCEKNAPKVLLLACEKTGLEEANCKCIHAFSYADLLTLKSDGIHQIHIAKGDCSDCSRGKNESLFQRVTHVNTMLKHRHLSLIHCNELSVQQWQQLSQKPEKSVPGPEMSRRMFFRTAIKQTIDSVMHQSTFGNNGEFIPLGEILPKSQSDQNIYPAVPHISSTKCNGCDACMRACPHQVISFQSDYNLNAYKINASICTACQICEDICDQDAIEINLWAHQKNDTVPLSNQICPSCGVDFHYPKLQSQTKKNDLCIICSRVNHRENLFQVI